MEEIISEENESNETQHIEPTKRVVVVPGEIVVSGEDYLPGEGVRREGNDVIASRFGLSEQMGHVIRVIPLSGAFVPRRNNVVLGRVVDILHNGWLIDIDAPNNAFLPIMESPRFINQHEMDQFLAIGDMIAAKIWTIKGKGIDLTIKSKGLGKLEGGFAFRINPTRVPRVIGREGSMISLIKDKTGCFITVGQNGWVWVNGQSSEGVIKARKAIDYIADNVHLGGLTDHMEEWFSKQ